MIKIKLSPHFQMYGINNIKENKNRSKISFHRNDTFEKSAVCTYFLAKEAKIVRKEDYPEDYLRKSGDKYFLKPHYVLFDLESFKKGDGTKAVKKVVLESLSNPLSQGRVILFSATLDNEQYSAGFYYKLGFRFTDKKNNEIMENWLLKDGKKETSPKLEGSMYLPKENILQCLNY